MPAPSNSFKQALQKKQTQIGLWLGLAGPYAAEICGKAGFDWLVVDGEHAPNDIPLILSQLQALAGTPSQPIVRVPIGTDWLIKQVLDLGVQTVLVPMVENADQARALVRATRYPPEGVRGVGAAIARASEFSAIHDYMQTANEQICLICQIESANALENIDEIAAVEGVDGLFIGPADLAASMGYLGNHDAPEVQTAMENAIARINSAGKAAGILIYDRPQAEHFLNLGASFVAVGADVTLLAQSAKELSAHFKKRGLNPKRGSVDHLMK